MRCMRPTPIVLALGLAALAAGCGGGVEPHRNVLLIVVDTLRADHLSCYGYPRDTSPNLDRLAAEGWRYEHAVSPAPWTTPSLAAVFTSRYPTMLGIEDVRSVVPDELTLLPEALARHGLTTGAVVSHSFCGSEWGFDQGFDSFDEANVLGPTGISSRGVTDAGIDFLDAHGDEPFFLWLHYFDPHNQYIPHQGFGAPPDPGYRGRVDPRTSFQRLKRMELDPAEIGVVQRYYDSEIAFTDHHVGRLLDHLEALGLTDRTAVIFTADHGEEFFDHGRLGHAHSLYDELVRVPLILKLPGRAPRTVSETVGTLDLFPTVLDILGLPVIDGLYGRSLLEGGERTIFTETSRHANLRAVVRGKRKLVRDLETGALTLFDLRADPDEQDPLEVGSDHELARVLEAWMREAEAAAVSSTELELPPELMEELGELGYAEDG